MDVWEKLRYPFDEKFVKWYKKGGIDLAYIDARDVMDRLDQVIGPENWSDEYRETASGRVICKLIIRVGNNIVSKEDGAGDTGIEGEKGGISDAFKRAAGKFGIGRYLYRLAGPSNVTGRLPAWALPGGPPAPSAYSSFPEDEDAQVPVNPNVVKLEEAKATAQMFDAFEKLKQKGIDKLGLDKFTSIVNAIINTEYGGVDWNSDNISLDVARKMYNDIDKAIESNLGGSA